MFVMGDEVKITKLPPLASVMHLEKLIDKRKKPCILIPPNKLNLNTTPIPPNSTN